MVLEYVDIPSYGDRHWKAPVATAFALPANGNQLGDIRVAVDTGVIYFWNGVAWILEVAPGATPPGGGDTQVQYNHLGAFAGSPFFTFNQTTHALTVAGLRYPIADGTAGQALTTNGAGVLAFSNASALDLVSYTQYGGF